MLACKRHPLSLFLSSRRVQIPSSAEHYPVSAITVNAATDASVVSHAWLKIHTTLHSVIIQPVPLTAVALRAADGSPWNVLRFVVFSLTFGTITHDFFFFFCTIYFPASGQAVVTGVIPSPLRFLPSIFIAHRVQQSHCSSIFHRMLQTHALALSASQSAHKKKSQRVYTSMHSAGLEFTKLTYTSLADKLIRHRGDRVYVVSCTVSWSRFNTP